MDKAKVLVIDDEKGPRESLRMILKDHYEVALADTALEGLRLVEEFQPDVVFLDIKIPDMVGTEVLRRIKETDPTIEVAMVTAYAAVESAQEAVRYGAIDYLTKPFGMNEVLRVAERAVQRRRERHEREAFLAQLQSATSTLSQQLQELRRKSEFADLSTIYEGLASAHSSLESQLDGMARLRAIGEIAAEVAHDVDNFLSAILVRIELLQARIKESADLDTAALETALQEIAQATMDSAHAIARISLTATDPYEPAQTVHLNQLLKDAVNLSAAQALPADATRIVWETEELPPLAGNAGGLRTALMNILINARQALAGSGEIRLRTYREGDEAVIEIRDSGPGIPPEVLDRVTEPFFTTKGAGGCGLGLSIARKVITRHDGDLKIKSQPGEGTTVTVRLPLGERRASFDLAASAVPEVLLVDDDERLLVLLADYLRAAGLQVETATSGTEALQQFERYLGTYHRAPQVVVTDARLPDLVGTELARRLKERAPLTRVVLLSAYVNAGVQTDSPYLDAVLAKPCDLSVLLREVAGLADFPLN